MADDLNCAAPVIEHHQGIDVARDDLLPGGTKSRYLDVLFDDCQEIVYASPVQGAAQIALAMSAQKLGKRCTIFTAKRGTRHANTQQALAHGANVIEVSFGMLSNVSAQAKRYAEQKPGAKLAPFGLRIPQAAECLERACSSIAQDYTEVWCAAGSGTLASALSGAFPRAKIYAVSVGHKIAPGEAGRARVLVYKRPFDREARVKPPFPSSPTFDAKAWEHLLRWYEWEPSSGRVLFWNVAP